MYTRSVFCQLISSIVLWAMSLQKGAVFLPPASEMVNRLSKTIQSSISDQHPTQALIHQSHYIDYIKAEGVPSQDRYHGLLRFVLVMEKGVYVKRLDKKWVDINAQKESSKKMEKLVEFNDSQKEDTITAAQIYGNESMLSIAHSNLTVEVIDLKKSSPGNLNVIVSFDASYKYGNEEGDTIRSIGRIPYSDQILIQANRFELIKLTRSTGTTERVRAPLDSVRHIVCPVPTGDIINDPHSPNRTKKATISQKAFDRGHQTTCILTGHHSPMNALVDWRTMRPVMHWSYPQLVNLIPPNATSHTIHSICFFGGLPEANLYLFTLNSVSYKIYSFSAIKKKMMDSITFNPVFWEGKLHWINHTRYVFASLRFDADSPFYYFLKVDKKAITHSRTYGFYDLRIRQVANTPLAKVLLEPAAEDFDSADYLDVLYLTYFANSNNFRVSPPTFEWDHCAGLSMWEPPSSYLKEEPISNMVYGRFKKCSACTTNFDKLEPSDDQSEDPMTVNITFNNCQIKLCTETDDLGKKFMRHHHWKIKYELLRTKIAPVLEKVEEESKCFPRYDLQKEEEGTANDNGCSPGFNLDRFGVCSMCNSYRYSDCLFFTAFVGAEHGYSDDYYTWIFSNYTSRKADEMNYFKGAEERRQQGAPISFGDMFRLYRRAVVGADPATTAWQHQRLGKRKACYKMTPNVVDPKSYTISVSTGYSLKPMKDFDYIDFGEQVLDFPNGTLNHNFCYKGCKIGFYYDFESMECRRCNVGCAHCLQFEQCELCKPGRNRVNRSKHGRERHEREGQCIIGCQEGFFTKRFSGECLECRKDCLICRDRGLKEKILNETDDEINHGFCLQCMNDKNDSNIPVYADTKTGLCVRECKGEHKVIQTIVRSDGSTYSICGRCKDPNCLSCVSLAANGCRVCSAGYGMNDNYECIKASNHSELLISITIVGSTAGLIFLLLFFTSLMAGPKTENKTTKKKFAKIPYERFKLPSKKKKDTVKNVRKNFVKLNFFGKKFTDF